MRIIKLNAIDSTNSYLKALSTKSDLEDYTVVVAKHQTDGRGQMGTFWTSKKDQNLTFSVFKRLSTVKFDDQFYISIATSLAIFKTLKYFSIPRVKIKWPNDILSDNKKICGILIENVIKQETLQATIIGIGLNVNQTEFKDLPNASSMRLINGSVFNLDEVLQVFLKQLEKYFNKLKAEKLKELKDAYEKELFRKNKPSTFKNEEGDLFTGFLNSVTDSGNLIVIVEDNQVKEFDLKSIQLLY